MTRYTNVATSRRRRLVQLLTQRDCARRLAAWLAAEGVALEPDTVGSPHAETPTLHDSTHS